MAVPIEERILGLVEVLQAQLDEAYVAHASVETMLQVERQTEALRAYLLARKSFLAAAIDAVEARINLIEQVIDGEAPDDLPPAVAALLGEP